MDPLTITPTTASETGQGTTTTASQLNLVGILSGGIVGAILIVMVSIAVFTIHKRRSSVNPSKDVEESKPLKQGSTTSEFQFTKS